MKILVLADIDDLRWQHGTGQADLILALGDIADCLILEAAEAYGAPPIFGVKGNHCSPTPFPEGITDLHLRTVEFGGISFGGFHGSWRYKLRGHYLFEQDEATALLEGFGYVDVLLAHNSPSGIHERGDEVHAGFLALNAYISRAKPKVVFHGHQHINKESTMGQTRVVGVYGHRLFEL